MNTLRESLGRIKFPGSQKKSQHSVSTTSESSGQPDSEVDKQCSKQCSSYDHGGEEGKTVHPGYAVSYDEQEQRNYANNPLAQMEDCSVEQLTQMGFMRQTTQSVSEEEGGSVGCEGKVGCEASNYAAQMMEQAKVDEKALWIWGYLNKLGGVHKTFKTRIFLLKPDGQLSYFDTLDGGSGQVDVKSLMASKCRGYIQLQDCKYCIVDRNLHMRVKDSFLFGITPKDPQARTFILEALSIKKRNLWFQVIGSIGGTELPPMDLPRAISGSLKEGYMEKMGEKEQNSGWRIRYFILSNKSLSYYKNYGAAQKNSCSGSVQLSASVVLRSDPSVLCGKPYCITLTQGNRKYLISCSDEAEKDQWIQLMRGITMRGISG